jgi:hypothetical protein
MDQRRADKIANADELPLSTQRTDGSLPNPVAIWVVRHGDDLYIRSYRGPGGLWFRHARERREGRIQAGGVDKNVTFADADHDLHDQIDTMRTVTRGSAHRSAADPQRSVPRNRSLSDWPRRPPHGPLAGFW